MKNLIRIFALPSHNVKNRNAGVDFIRIVQPMTYLNSYEDDKCKFQVEIYDISKEITPTEWHEIARNFDIIYFNYLTLDWGFAAMGVTARKFNRLLVMDIDDALWHILSDNNAYRIYQKGSKGIHIVTSILNEVDYITCTNGYLRNIIIHNTYKRHEQVKVFPNYIDLDLYSHRSPFKDTLDITALHYGSSTHYSSLMNEEFEKGIDRIMSEYPNFNFLTVGSHFPKYKEKWGKRYQHDFGAEDIYKWIGKMPQFMDKADFIVAPLNDNVYNRAKSSCKFIETASYKKPMVAQRIRQYEEVIKDGVNGFLCYYADDWYNKIKKLIEDKQMRRNMGEEAFKTVEKDWQIKGHIKEYASFFNDILTK